MSHRKTWKGSLLVCGEPGTGKSRWIREEANATHSRIFRWNARVDRSLRDGREKLHQQVRSREALFVWIEGADDLTQEAQAFLRRILETASPNVVCALEARELWKMSSPVLSRCTIISMKSDTSYRSLKNIQRANQLGLISTTQIPSVLSLKDLPALRIQGEDPYKLIDHVLKINESKNCLEGDSLIRMGTLCPSESGITLSNSAIQSMKMIGAGSSPWIQLANILASSNATLPR